MCTEQAKPDFISSYCYENWFDMLFPAKFFAYTQNKIAELQPNILSWKRVMNKKNKMLNIEKNWEVLNIANFAAFAGINDCIKNCKIFGPHGL